jgi:phosphoribosylaminoimidazolecarboxamide formyltransferase/IMP cyclohydrolase
VEKKINSALISVYDKTGLEPVIAALKKQKIAIYSTGGTYDFIVSLGAEAKKIEDLTSFPSILGGRVKTLHPKVFGGILSRRNHVDDKVQMKEYRIPEIDLVIVDLYPFSETLASGASEVEVIEKIDIGGVSLIRAAAKNFHDVVVIPSKDHYPELLKILYDNSGYSDLKKRKKLAGDAFALTNSYDASIHNFLAGKEQGSDSASSEHRRQLRYGENPHQEACYIGDLSEVFEQFSGKDLSYNNLLDAEAAVSLMGDFNETTYAVIKHNNACGLASHENETEAYKRALQGDPVSAFGGIIVTNREVTLAAATEINKLFFEIIIAPAYAPEALKILFEKKNRIILVQKNFSFLSFHRRSLFNGMLEQTRDKKTETKKDLKVVTVKSPTEKETEDLLFANKVVKHLKSNAVVIAKDRQMIGSGAGETSRVDALKHAMEKTKRNGFGTGGAVMASDAFFPFDDCVKLAHKEGITAIIQPGGSVRDQDSINFCNQNGLSMVFTGTRHFKH